MAHLLVTGLISISVKLHTCGRGTKLEALLSARDSSASLPQSLVGAVTLSSHLFSVRSDSNLLLLDCDNLAFDPCLLLVLQPHESAWNHHVAGCRGSLDGTHMRQITGKEGRSQVAAKIDRRRRFALPSTLRGWKGEHRLLGVRV